MLFQEPTHLLSICATVTSQKFSAFEQVQDSSGFVVWNMTYNKALLRIRAPLYV